MQTSCQNKVGGYDDVKNSNKQTLSSTKIPQSHIPYPQILYTSQSKLFDTYISEKLLLSSIICVVGIY